MILDDISIGKLRDGSVKVKGGWRIYSSGPGIYMNQLISNCLGIRHEAHHVVIDPMIPIDLDGMIFDYQVDGKPVSFRYHLNQDKKRVTLNGQTLEASVLTNRYREPNRWFDEQYLPTYT